MKKNLALILMSLFLIGFVSAGVTGSITNENLVNQENKNSNEVLAQTPNQEEVQKNITDNVQNQIRERINEAIQSKNRIRVNIQNQSECPENCTCTGVATKCQTERGREMTIQAGKSGNVIFQVKNAEASTEVELYKNEGKIYGVFRNNQTKKINMMPDQVKEKIQERLKIRNCSCKIELDDDGEYKIQVQKKMRLFNLFPVKARVLTNVNVETGEIIRVKNPWWGFLAGDVEEEPLLGADCGTVSPESKDECCIEKGYDYWDSEKEECLFQ
ncbi:MAG: hypothetical protein ABH804_01735 [archaeon]